MRSLAGLAELARFAALLPRDEAREAARMLGYAPSELDARPEVQAPPPREPTAQERFEEAVASLDARPSPAAFWRVERYEPLPDVEALPTFTSSLTDPLLPEERGGRLFDTPEAPPLTPWRHLWPALHEALRSELPGRDPDLPALVRRWARGEPVTRLPRVRRRAWASNAALWVDRSARLLPLWRDQERVVKGLRRVMGRALRVQRLDEGDTRRLASRAWLARQRLDATTPVLVLGDLGVFGDAREAWGRAFEALAGLGVRATALVPWSVRQQPRRAGPRIHASSWERGVSVRRDDGGLVARLLTLVASAAFVQPGMLRALRWLLPGAGVEVELAVWNHPAVDARDATGLVLRAAEARAWQTRFAALDDALQARVREVIAAWHGRLPRELVYGESLTWSQIARVEAPADLQAARAFAERLAGVVSSGSASDPRAWLQYGRALTSTVPPSVLAANPALAVVWDVAHEGLDAVSLPEGVDLAAIRARRRQGRVARAWALRQVGDALVASPRDDARWPSEVTGPGSPVLLVTTTGPELLVTQGTTRTQRVLDAGAALPLAAGGAMSITDAQGTHELVACRREAWMSRLERDRHGLWAEVEVKGVRFRMRWIPPGRFVMGSPEGEEGRYEWEGPQHDVVLTEGYWLGETLVTQALWFAVKGSNPSRIQGLERPVERVSWDDVQDFVKRLNARLPGLEARLPTEAEWERACRGGTTGATWLGANDEETLYAIAWWGDNSGGETQPVGQKAVNPYGLYDMLGNVWEWCGDAQRKYDAALVRDPYDISSSPRRVYRGGSWFSGAGYVRAAARDALEPSLRDVVLGLRLARGQGLRSSTSTQSEDAKAPPEDDIPRRRAR